MFLSFLLLLRCVVCRCAVDVYTWIDAHCFSFHVPSFLQLVEAGCNVIALSRNGAPVDGGSWVNSVKWVEANALVRETQREAGRQTEDLSM